MKYILNYSLSQMREYLEDEYKPVKFCPLEYNMFAIESTGFNWNNYQKFIFNCMQSTSKIGFFVVDIWWPGIKPTQAALNKLFPNAKILISYIYGYFDINKENISNIFDVWNERGAWNSGEWYIGGCDSEFINPEKILQLPVDEFIFEQINKVGCLLCMEDRQGTIFLSRTFDGYQEGLPGLT